MSDGKDGPVLIVGAGIGGLSAGIRLAAAGEQVVIYEKNPQVGGKMYEHRADSYRWDMGPSVVTMRHVFEELFAAAGRNLADYLTLEPVDPLTRYFYKDGTVLDASGNIRKMAQQIAAIDRRDVQGYLNYLGYVAEIHRITGPVFIYDRAPTWRSFLRVPFRDWFRVDPFRTMDQAIRGFVRSPHLRQLLGRFATYVGGSPYLAPATLNVIADVELNGGVYYPRGGIYAIARAMAQLATELGVQIETGRGIREIVVRDGRAAGLTLEDGTPVTGKAVISNVDVSTSYTHLLPAGLQAPPLNEPSCSGFALLLGVEKEHPALAHHNIFFSDDYPAEFDAIFKQGVPPADPTIYVSITSKTDADHAPAGSENWFVLVNAPPLGDQFDWDAQKTAYRDLVLEKLAAHGVDIRDAIRHERLLTPQDLAAGSGAWRGALYGASPNNRFAAFRRAPNRAPDVRGLYFAGGTTHPGGGVPMVTLSGKVAAEMVLGDG
jgi:diapolycopene oxygenase